jgi:hypothetical protein
MGAESETALKQTTAKAPKGMLQSVPFFFFFFFPIISLISWGFHRDVASAWARFLRFG